MYIFCSWHSEAWWGQGEANGQDLWWRPCHGVCSLHFCATCMCHGILANLVETHSPKCLGWLCLLTFIVPGCHLLEQAGIDCLGPRRQTPGQHREVWEMGLSSCSMVLIPEGATGLALTHRNLFLIACWRLKFKNPSGNSSESWITSQKYFPYLWSQWCFCLG